MMIAKRRREKLRRQCGDHAVDPGYAGAHRDQREHVEVAGNHGAPAAHEERGAGPQHHRRRQHEGNPVRSGRRDQIHQAEMRAHLQHEHRQRERQRDLETPTHIDQFGIRRILERNLFGLQRHPADRTGAGADLPDLRIHRTDVDRSGRRRGRRLLRLQKGFRIGGKALAAAAAAEQVIHILVAEAMLGRGAFDLHAAHRIGLAHIDGGWRLVRRATARAMLVNNLCHWTLVA